MMKNPVHPGVILREDILGELNMNISELAESLGVSRVTLSRVLNGRAAVSPNLALRLQLAGIGTARSWLSMQTMFDLARLEKSEQPHVRKLINV